MLQDRVTNWCCFIRARVTEFLHFYLSLDAWETNSPEFVTTPSWSISTNSGEFVSQASRRFSLILSPLIPCIFTASVPRNRKNTRSFHKKSRDSHRKYKGYLPGCVGDELSWVRNDALVDAFTNSGEFVSHASSDKSRNKNSVTRAYKAIAFRHPIM